MHTAAWDRCRQYGNEKVGIGTCVDKLSILLCISDDTLDRDGIESLHRFLKSCGVSLVWSRTSKDV